MELHQLQVIYQVEQDRLLCRASFKRDDGGLQEIRTWLTRRMVSNLWPAMIQVLETQVSLEKPDVAHVKSEIVGMEHETSLHRMREAGSFDTPYEAHVDEFPLGEHPLLIHHVDFRMDPGQPIRVTLRPAEGQGFELAMAPAMFHAFCELILEAAGRAEWGLNLKRPGSTAPRSSALN